MFPANIWLWQRAPALRLLAPFVVGIFLQWHIRLPSLVTWLMLTLFAALLLVMALVPLRVQFKAATLRGFALTGLVAATAMCLVHAHDIRNNNTWFGRHYTGNEGLLVTVQEPLVEKPNSYKARAHVEKIIRNDSLVPASGELLLYFKKDAIAQLSYGSQLWVFEKVQPVTNSGNPAAFDYVRYNLFAGITHQAYLARNDFLVLPTHKKHWVDETIFTVRSKILSVLKTHIRGAKETGLAEALLIGYKDDLDKTLVQSYSNTGVVHIIAISGLHVGLIYGLLLLLTKPLRGKRLRWLRFFIMLASLWGFGLLAGAQPSVMRSVVMFSVIAAGVVLDRNTSIYNNLALSALLLLWYNPFWLWDVGFQLSYMAVLSIVIFFKPVYNWFYVQNKAVDAVWKLLAVTLAAQILTIPISLYYFHQFPLLFLFTNLIAVPLSSAILIGELLLSTLFFIPPLAQAVGWLTTGAIHLMNAFIERLEAFPASLWQGLYLSPAQVVLLLLFIAAISFWLLEQKRSGLWVGVSCLLAFTALRTFSFIHAAQQQKLVVYNIARHQSIDVFSGRACTFIGDVALMQNDPATKLHLQPSRIAHRMRSLSCSQAKAFTFCNKRIVIIDTTLRLPTFSKPHIDVLILSKNPRLYIKQLTAAFDIAQIVIDASVPAWKARQWQRDCDALHLPCHNVAQKGAFVMPLPHTTFAAL